ncbi:MAG: Carbon-nitrogen hydrolase [Peltula sp. TS41687]|nr:MAG: Carbon-nitrogen hydrolase [Peltula sp. TS41687]
MDSNLQRCRALVAQASAHGAKVLFLPEASDYIASSADETVSLARPIEESPFVQGLREEARRATLHINVGIHEPCATAPGNNSTSTSNSNSDNSKVKNILIWIDSNGKVVQRYQKIHLFDVDLLNTPHGPLVLKESASVEQGGAITTPFETPVGRVGLAICYDLRFPEISLALRRQGAQIITYPSAFTVATGRAHWEVLLRARAIETQSFVVAAAQVGRHGGKRVSYGRSMIVNPWGEIIAELPAADGAGDGGGDGPGETELAVADIDLELLQRVRREMPLVRRSDKRVKTRR